MGFEERLRAWASQQRETMASAERDCRGRARSIEDEHRARMAEGRRELSRLRVLDLAKTFEKFAWQAYGPPPPTFHGDKPKKAEVRESRDYLYIDVHAGQRTVVHESRDEYGYHGGHVESIISLHVGYNCTTRELTIAGTVKPLEQWTRREIEATILGKLQAGR